MKQITTFILTLFVFCSISAQTNNFDMTKREMPKLFEDRKIRTVWDDEQEKWYFSIVDVVGALVV